jgi:hypothetical protein
MADDGVLQIGTKVNIGPLQSGMAQAQQAVVSASETVAKAQLNAKQAADAMSAAYIKFGESASRGSEQAKAALLAHRQALNEARDAVGLWSRELKIADAELLSMVQGEGAVSVSTRALNAEMSVLKGNIGSTRAATQLLMSSFPALASAMQIAFPVFGAIALAGILGQAFDGVEKLVRAFRDLDGAETKAGFDAILAGDKVLKLKADKFTADEAARLIEGAPANKDIETVNAQVALKKIQNARELQDAQAQVNEQALTGAALQKQKIADIQKIDFTRQAEQQAKALAAAYEKQGEAHTQINTVVAGHSGVVRSTQSVANISDPKQIEALQQQARIATQAAEQYQQDIEMLQVKMQGASAKLPRVEDKEGESAANKAAEAMRKASEDAIRAQEDLLVSKESILGKSAEVSAKFWASEAAVSQKGSLEYIHALKSLQQAQAEILTSTNSEKTKFGKESADAVSSIAETQTKPDLAGIQEAAKATIAWAQTVHAGTDAQRQSEYALQEASIKAAEASGTMTKLGAAHAMAALHAKEYSDRLATLQAQLKAINSADYLNPMEKKGQSQGVQNQIGSLQGQNALTGMGDASAIANQIAQPYITAFDSINNSWLQLQGKLIFGTRNIGVQFANMGVNILESVAASFEKMLLKSAEAEIKMVIQHHAAQAQIAAATTVSQQMQVAATAQAGAETQSISLLTSLKLITHNASVAASAVFASTAGIPIIGPFLAPVAAAGTFAAVEALAAFETGGIIPNTGVALVHQGESVLPAQLTNFLVNAAGNTHNNSSSASQINNFHGNTDAQFRRAASRNAGHMLSVVHRGLRQKGSR